MKKANRIILAASLLGSSMLACQFFGGVTVTPQATPSPTIQAIPSAVHTQVTQSPAPTPAGAVQVIPDLANAQDLLVKLYERVHQGVVAIQVLTEQGGGLGSGFVIDQDGHIVTNYHVVENMTDLEVDFPSGFKVRGEVIGTDLDSDIAVVKVDAPQGELHPLEFGDSDQLSVGQTVVAIGNPFGFSGTMTVGIVSAKGRSLESLHEAPGGGIFTAGDIIQTDTSINPGNSGGPLLNLDGQVIGVNRAIQLDVSTGQPTNSGIGFAISGNIVKKVIPSLISQGKYDYPYLGINSLPELTLLRQEALGLPIARGAYINGITPNSPAEKAGLRGGTRSTDFPNLLAGGDLITAIDGQPILTFDDMISYLIKNKSPGDDVILTILRDKAEMDITVVLDKRP